ncbi:MAG: hypothetical protein ABSA84_03960 [Gammaproteobacteria bacterium]|jgi:chromosome segregation ATPase
MQKKIKEVFKENLVWINILLVSISCICLQQFFNKKLNVKIAAVEQEQQVFMEQFNNKLLKVNKQLMAVKEENRNLQTINQVLEKKSKEFQFAQNDTEYKISALNDQKLQLEEAYDLEKKAFLHKITALNKNKTELEELIKELQLQIKNSKDNSYSLFQAGKLEVELSNVEQQLSEQYESISQKKSNLNNLKDKCGKLRTNSSYCKEHDTISLNVATLEQQIEHLKAKREDLKQRINFYLSSAKQ